MLQEKKVQAWENVCVRDFLLGPMLFDDLPIGSMGGVCVCIYVLSPQHTLQEKGEKEKEASNRLSIIPLI